MQLLLLLECLSAVSIGDLTLLIKRIGRVDLGKLTVLYAYYAEVEVLSHCIGSRQHWSRSDE